MIIDQKNTWEHLEWDETFHAARKFQRGSREREGGTVTFAGGVRVSEDPQGKKTVLYGVMKLCANKGREETNDLLITLAENGATVETDGAGMYKDLSATGLRHHFVNHKKCFVTRSDEKEKIRQILWKGFGVW